MKLPAITAAAVFLVLQPARVFTQQQAQPEKASIEGTIIRMGTGEPIRARVIVTRAAGSPVTTPPPANLSAPPAIPSVMTDAQGKFVMKDIEAGSYRLSVAANGYARQEYGQRVFGSQGTTISLATGQSLKDIVVRLTPAGNVTGRISDDLGLPAVGVQVQLLRASYNAQGQRTFQSGGQTRTNDQGEYRLFWVTPGRYYLFAGSQPGLNRSLDQGGVGDSPNGIAESYAATYYPGAADIKEAAIIEVQPGVEVSAIDFSIPRQRLFRIRGRLIDSRTGQKPTGASLTLSSRALTGGGFTSGLNQSYDAATGTFEIRDVSPGTYTVNAQFQEPNAPATVGPGGPPRPLASTAVTVSNGDVDGIVLTIVAGVSLPGRLAVEGQELSALPGLDRLRVQLRAAVGDVPAPGVQQAPLAQPINADGTFREDNTMPGQYLVSVPLLPPGYYLKEVRFDQTDALNKPLVFTGSISGPLEVLISPRAGQIEGTVVNDKQAMPGMQVVLIPDQNRQRIDLYKTAMTDSAGRFTIRSITPGTYKLFSWEAIEQFAYFDSDLVQRFEALGKAVRIFESDKQTVEVKIIPAGGQ